MKKVYFPKCRYHATNMPDLILRAMRITIFLTLACVVNLYATGYSQGTKLTLNLKDVKLSDIFNVIQQKTSYQFLYNDEEVAKAPLVSVHVKDATVRDIMAVCFTGSYPLEYKIEDSTIIIMEKPIFSHIPGFPPILKMFQFIIKGKVTDSLGKPLIGVSVRVKGTSTGTVTDANGNYSLTLENRNGILVFSYIGYIKKEVAIGNQSDINVTLEETNSNLNQVVVVGYKSVTERNLSGAVSSVNMDELKSIPSASLLSLLAGKVPGMQVVMRTGLPGGSTGGLVIRGNTNLSAADNVTGLSNPLYIVDGVPISLSDLAGFDVTQNDFFATLNPNDIQSIEILKDAAATAIYGARGANGVVIITTKHGYSGATRFNFSYAYGVNFQPPKLKVYIGEAEREQKLKLIKSSLAALFGEDTSFVDVRNGLEILGYALPPVLTDKNNPAFNNAYDYQNMFYQNGLTQQYNLDMEGGNEKNTFRVGLGYFKERGILVGFNFSRYTLNASLINNLPGNISNTLSMRFSYLGRLGGNTDNMRSFPTDPTQLPSSLYYKTPQELAYFHGQLGDTRQSNNSYLGSISEEIKIPVTKDISWDNMGAFSSNFGRSDYFVPSTASVNQQSYSSASASENFTISAHSTLSYYHKSKNHAITGLAGTEINLERQSAVNLIGQNGPSDYIQVVQGFKKGNIDGTSDYVKTNMFSYFGDVAYAYKDRYDIEGTIRRDASSRFGGNNKWASFPSIKGYWIFSDEPWMKSTNKALSFGKMRLSYGMSGNVDSDPLLQYNSLITPTNIGADLNNIYENKLQVGTYGGGNSVISDFNKIANNSLSWEKTSEIDYGLDLQFFDHRLYFTGDVYSKYIKGAVFTSQLAPYVGYNSIRSNLVDMIANGWEVSLNGYLFPRDSKFQWSWTLNLSRNQTVIAKLGNGGRDFISGNYAFVQGEQAFQYYTYNYLGPLQRVNDLPVNPMTGQPLQYLWADAGLALNEQGKIFPGMPLFKDVNGDYLIDGDSYGYDDMIIPNKSPEPKLIGGLNTSLQYKGLTLRVESSFEFGFYVFNTSLQQMLSHYDDPIAFYEYALYQLPTSVSFWQKPGDKAYYPMRYISYSDGGSARSFRPSSMFIEKGNYWSIDNATLSYNLPERITKKLGVKGVNVYTTIENVYMWKSSIVPDPRIISKTGYYDGQGYPISRSMLFGIKFNF